MNKAFRYSVSLIFIVERDNRTIFSCILSSSTLIDSWAFSSYEYNDKKSNEATVITSTNMRTEPITEATALFLL